MIQSNEVEYWASLGQVEKVRQALERGHDINAQSENGYTALHAAAENGHLDVLRLLLQCGANTNAQVSSGETPLDLALMAGQQEAAELLRRYHHQAEKQA